MVNYILYSIIYLILLLLIIYLSKKLDLVDKPNYRKLHSNKIVNTGGIAIYFFMILVVMTNEYSFEVESIIAIGSIVILTGFLDDRVDISPSVKLILLIFPTIYLLTNGFLLENLGQYEFIGKIDLGKFGLIFTVLAVGLLINSYNYIDGIDGLLLGNFIAALGYIIILNNDHNLNILLTYFLICCTISLFFNLLPGKNYFKVFLGDGGSLFFGFFISFLLIYMFMFQKVHPAYLIWTCWYPVYDFLSVTFNRIKKKKKVYKADKFHLHHIILTKFKNSHLKSSIFLNLTNISVLFIGFSITSFIGKIYSLLFFVLFFAIFFIIREKI